MPSWGLHKRFSHCLQHYHNIYVPAGVARESIGEGSKFLGPCTYVRDMNKAPGFNLAQPWSTADDWRMNQQMGKFFYFQISKKCLPSSFFCIFSNSSVPLRPNSTHISCSRSPLVIPPYDLYLSVHEI